jgi:hypothetical protein
LCDDFLKAIGHRDDLLEPRLWRVVFELLAEAFKERNPAQTYVVDSLPVAACDNIRIRRCRLYPPEESAGAFRGYIPSKRRYFYGLRVHLVVTGAGEPVEFSLEAASETDIKVFKDLGLDLLPEGATIFADKGYTDYDHEDLLEEAGGLHLKAAQEELQAADAGVGGVFRQTDPPIHRDGLRPVE